MPGTYKLSEEHEMVRNMAREIAREKLAPRAADIDRAGEFPWDIVELYRENDILGMPIPMEYGGQGADATSCQLVVEEFAKECSNSAHILADNWLTGL